MMGRERLLSKRECREKKSKADNVFKYSKRERKGRGGGDKE